MATRFIAAVLQIDTSGARQLRCRSEVVGQQLSVRIHVFDEALPQRGAEMRMRNHGAKRAVQDLPARRRKATACRNVCQSFKVNCPQVHIGCQLVHRRHVFERSMDVIRRSIDLISRASKTRKSRETTRGVRRESSAQRFEIGRAGRFDVESAPRGLRECWINR